MKLKELPENIRKFSSYFDGGIKIVLSHYDYMTKEDIKKLPEMKKWIKSHGGYYIDSGYWFLEMNDE